MTFDEVMNKCTTDLDEMMSSIEAIKGNKFARILALHINYCTLITLTNNLDDEESNATLNKALRRTAFLCATESMSQLCEMSGLDEQSSKELLEWGDRLHDMISGNLNQLRSKE